MGKSKTLNFDQFVSAKNHDYILVTAFGKEYKVKNEIPAIVPIMLARAGEGKSDSSEIGLAMMKAGDVMFGKAAIDEMCEAGASTADLARLFKMIFSMISGVDVDGEELDEETYGDDSGKVVADGGSSSKK